MKQVCVSSLQSCPFEQSKPLTHSTHDGVMPLVSPGILRLEAWTPRADQVPGGLSFSATLESIKINARSDQVVIGRADDGPVP